MEEDPLLCSTAVPCRSLVVSLALPAFAISFASSLARCPERDRVLLYSLDKYLQLGLDLLEHVLLALLLEVAQLDSADLARHRLGQRLDKLDLARDLVRARVLLKGRLQRGRASRGIRLERVEREEGTRDAPGCRR